MSEKKIPRPKSVKTIWYMQIEADADPHPYVSRITADKSKPTGTVLTDPELREHRRFGGWGGYKFIGVYMSEKSRRDEVIDVFKKISLEQDKELNSALSVLDDLFVF